MKSFNAIIIALLCLTSVACDTKRNPYFGDGESQFILSAVRATSTQALGRNSFDQVNHVRFDLRVCVTDFSGNALPPKLGFEIKMESDSLFRQTDDEGCFGWQKSIIFDPLQPEKYYIIKTHFISRNDLRGQASVELALNPWRRQAIDLKKNPEATPSAADTIRVEDQVNRNKTPKSPDASTQSEVQPDFLPTEETPKPEQQVEIAPSPETTVESTLTHDAPSPQSQPSVEYLKQWEDSRLPHSNIYIKERGNQVPLKIVIPTVLLRRLRLHQQTPFTLDEYLNLTTHEEYEFSALPRFFMKNLDASETEVTPRGGQFRVTVGLIEEPEYNPDLMWELLKEFKKPQEVLDSPLKSDEIKELQSAIRRWAQEDPQILSANLSIDQKRLLMARTILPYVQDTQQFVSQLRPQRGVEERLTLRFNRLSHLRNRSFLVVTMEPLSQDITYPVKADAVGHATLGIQEIWRLGVLYDMKLEADLIHAERVRLGKLKKPPKPMDLFLRRSAGNTKSTNSRVLNKDAIKKDDFLLNFSKDYDFKENLDKYFAKSLDKKAQKLFLQALCYKIFVHSDFEGIETKPQSHTERLIRSYNCASGPIGYINIQEVEFLEKAPGANVEKVGHALKRTLSVSRTILKTREDNLNYGMTTFARGTFGPYYKTSGFIISLGREWYYTHTKSENHKKITELMSNLTFRLIVDTTQFKIKYDARKCLKINLSSYTIKGFQRHYKNLDLEKLPELYIVCSDNVSKGERIEDYYVIYEDCMEDIRTQDCSSPEENRFRLVIRGKQVYEFFEEMILDKSKNLQMASIPQSLVRQEVLDWEYQFQSFVTAQVFPGMFWDPQ